MVSTTRQVGVVAGADVQRPSGTGKVPSRAVRGLTGPPMADAWRVAAPMSSTPVGEDAYRSDPDRRRATRLVGGIE